MSCSQPANAVPPSTTPQLDVCEGPSPQPCEAEKGREDRTMEFYSFLTSRSSKLEKMPLSIPRKTLLMTPRGIAHPKPHVGKNTTGTAEAPVT